MKHILIIDDENFIRENLERILRQDSYIVFTAKDGNTGIDIINKENIDIVLLDLNLPDINGIEVLKRIKSIAPDVLVIIITGYATVDSAVEALKLGAYDYIKKPFKADAIKLIVKLALEAQSLKREVHVLRKLGRKEEFIVAESESMKSALKQALEVAKYKDTNVLITGESGTGKEVIARLIHENSSRNLYPFVDINCASLPENLLESELFGYEKGAFTDAKTSKNGLLQEAEGGTIFLDEIGEMPLSLQSKILRVIETRQIRKIGSIKNISIDVRIISATNRDLKKAVEEKRFREDLYYRLNVFPIHLKPLRERKEDIIPLAKYFLERFSKLFNRKFKDIDEDVQSIFLKCKWYGNVRELRNVIERICIMHDGEILDVNHLPSDLIESCDDLESVEGVRSLADEVSAFEKKIILDALNKTGGNILRAAKLLNIPRGTLRHKIDKYKIK
ncbi:MAG: sigma-54 dependent transcriptional regulator [Proteobacteria bacterium]|nr:sigma-54 dependent transcriptional regulator [Pseudomonadota bacterium]